MTEKEFRKLVTDLELSNDEKQVLNEKLDNIKALFTNYTTPYFKTIDVKKTGSWAKGTMINDTDEIDMMIIVEPSYEKSFVLENEVILNDITNILITHLPTITKLSDIIRNVSRNSISIKMDNFLIHLHIRYRGDVFSSLLEEKQIEFTEIANRDYTYFRNALKIIQYYKGEQNIHISGYILEIILYYALNEYFKDNRYEDYLNNFIKALDDFMKGKKIEVSPDIYQKLNIHYESNVKKPYMVLDVVDPNNNLTDYVNEISLGEYRKLKKVISKLVDTRTNFSMNANAVVCIHIDPVKIKDSDEFAWSYQIENTDFRNTGGSYQNTADQLLTAMFKSLYKGLRTVVDNHLNRKKVEIVCNKGNILKRTDVTEDNKSRIKTIEAYIENNGLIVTFR